MYQLASVHLAGAAGQGTLSFGNCARGFVKRDTVHLALRERERLRAILLECGAVGGVWFLAVMIGPFGTFGQLTPFERVQYWGMSIVLNWFQIRLAHHFLDRLTGQDRFWLPAIGACVLASLPATFEVIWLEETFRPETRPHISFLSLYPQVLILSLAITIPIMRFFIDREQDVPGRLETAAAPPQGQEQQPEPQTGNATAQAVAAPRFLLRVPTRLGRDLLCLQAEDHYVRVHTALGDDLVLHRFSDAVEELDGMPGLQVHRSWWIAEAAVADVIRRDRKTWLRLRNGLEVPVSRTYQAAVREAGWT